MNNDTGKPFLKVSNLVVDYARGGFFSRRKNVRFVAVDNVTFSVMQGQTLAIVGQSGSGKTSLAMAILGFVQPAGGTIEFAGSDIRNLYANKNRPERPRIQPIFQDCGAALNPQMTIGRAISDGLPVSLPSSRQKSQVLELMSRVGLPGDLFQAYPRQLSGGQKQRVCLARALAVGAECLILDEPFSAQDLSVQAQLMLLLRELKSGLDLTYLLISHDLTTVRLLADKILVMRGGKMIEFGDIAEILSAPQTDYTKELVRQAGILPQ
ncbi:MAG: ATP-binding cassette domain-containing protein [Candidatus Neomarinimicrobiota bacterium]